MSWNRFGPHLALTLPPSSLSLKHANVFTFICSSDDMDGPVEDIGSRSCVTRFVKTLLSIMEHGVKPHSKHLTEYFAFLYEFVKMGEEEVLFVSVYIFWWYICLQRVD